MSLRFLSRAPKNRSTTRRRRSHHAGVGVPRLPPPKGGTPFFFFPQPPCQISRMGVESGGERREKGRRGDRKRERERERERDGVGGSPSPVRLFAGRARARNGALGAGVAQRVGDAVSPCVAAEDVHQGAAPNSGAGQEGDGLGEEGGGVREGAKKVEAWEEPAWRSISTFRTRRRGWKWGRSGGRGCRHLLLPPFFLLHLPLRRRNRRRGVHCHRRHGRRRPRLRRMHRLSRRKEEGGGRRGRRGPFRVAGRADRCPG